MSDQQGFRSRVAVAAVVAAAAVGLAAGCSAGSGGSGGSASSGGGTAGSVTAADLSKVTLRIGDQKGAGLEALLKSAGQLDDLPYKLTWSEFTSGPPMMQALGANAIDFATVGDTPPIYSAAAGAKIKLIAAYKAGPDALGIVVPKGSPIRSLADLKGKKVAVAKASAAHYLLLSALKKAGLTLSDIEPAYLQPTNALASLRSGSVDAWVVWQPYIAIANHLFGSSLLVNANGLGTGLSFEVASQKALDNPAKEAALRDVLGRLARARAWAIAHNDEYATAWAKQVGIPADVAKQALKAQSITAIPVDDSVVAAEQAEADAFYEAEQIPNKVDVARIADRRFNAAIAAAG